MADPESLDRLMSRLADGDRAAFSPLFQALWAPALKVCQRLVNDADAADAAQAAMMKILERANEYDKQRPALPWALGIAAWECRTLLKRQQRLNETSADAAGLRSDEGATAREAEQKLLVSAAMHAMGALSAADQETLVATYWETDGAVGGGTFRKRRERALTRLRDRFRRLYGLD
ncbi:MAG: sigma-70 family RNA polymerase sigma factor [Myxococcus sp.]|nr:sigma-70 family RNA polymerase sigma factor [Myxococcus sp.]